MSSTMVFVFGILSLSISALATNHISKRRRASAKEARNRTRPLILPWLVSSDLATRRWSDGHSGNYPIIIDLPSKPHDQPARRKHAKTFSTTPRAADSSSLYLPYIDPPKFPLSSLDGGGSSEDSLQVYSPHESTSSDGTISPISPSYNADEVSLPQEIAPKRLSFNSLATKNDFDSTLDQVIHPKCDLLDARNSIFSNRDSVSSVSSTVYPRDRESVCGIDEFQKLEFVIGSGHRLQAQYGTLGSAGANFHVPILTPIKKVHQFD